MGVLHSRCVRETESAVPFRDVRAWALCSAPTRENKSRAAKSASVLRRRSSRAGLLDRRCETRGESASVVRSRASARISDFVSL